MKLKFANSLLIAGLIVGCAGCFTSCKDTDEDMFDNLEKKIDTAQTLAEACESRISALESAVTSLQNADTQLGQRIDDLKSELEAKIAAIKECECDPAEIASLVSDVQDLQSTISSLEAAQSVLEGRIDAIEATLQNLPPDLTEQVQELQGQYSQLAGDLASVQGTLSDVQTDLGNLTNSVTELLQETIPQIINDLGNIYDRLDGHDEAIEKLQQLVDDANTEISILQDQVGMIDTLISDLQNKDDDLQAQIDLLREDADAALDYCAQLDLLLQDAVRNLEFEIEAMQKDLQDQIDAAYDEIHGLDNAIFELGLRVSDNEKNIKDLYYQLEQIKNQIDTLEKRVSSVIIQEVYNPYIGCISAPVGVQTNILFNWFGYNDYAEQGVEVTFPNFDLTASNNFGLQDTSYPSAEVLAALGINYEVLPEGDYLPSDGYFGHVYFSVNPTNINLASGYEVALVNSQGEASPLKLEAPKASDAILTWGLSRANSTTLWVANSNLAVSDIGKLRLRSDDNLKATMVEALKARTLQSLAEVGITAYKTITNNSSLPMLGLMVTNTTSGESAISQLSIAAGSVRPLSYNTADGANYSDKLPAWPNLEDWVTRIQNKVNGYFDEYNSKLHFEFETIEIKDFPVDKIEIDVTINPDAPENVIGQFTDPLTGAIVYVYGEDLIKVLEEIKNQLADYSESVGADINDMLDDLQAQIDKMVEDMSEEVNSTIADVLGDMQQTINNAIEKVADRISGYWDKMGTIYNHIYNVFKNPNHYMQAYLFYHDPVAGKIGRFSNTKAAPTIFTGNGDAVTLIATTLNAELLTPAYKKYVAVTNVWDADGNFDADALKKANSSSRMNEVVAGDYQTFTFNYQKGYTYEIFYQALDFHGATSTQKYYVTVK